MPCDAMMEQDAFKSAPATLRLAQSPYMSPRQAAMQQQVCLHD